MTVLIGAVIVTVGVIGGYLMEHGNLHVLWQPAEFVIIYGAAFGAYVTSYPVQTLKDVIAMLKKILSGKTHFHKAQYISVLTMLFEIYNKIRKDGLIAIEGDVDRPKESKLFSKYPDVLANEYALNFITDTLRTIITTTIEPHEMEALLDSQLEFHKEEIMLPSQSVTSTADALPGLGIVAAVLGVVLTMGKMGEPPEVLGHSIGAALVGTFLGVLMCYGYMGPLAKALEIAAHHEMEYLQVIKTSLMSSIAGSPPAIAVEFGRSVIPMHERPTFAEVENKLKQAKK